MKQKFKGWKTVAKHLKDFANKQQQLADAKDDTFTRLNAGQRASLYALAERLPENGVIIADEVGMGKTRIAVELARSVVESGGRVAILVPPGLGYQWQAELRDGGVDAPAILRSLWAYLAAWEAGQEGGQQPWFEKNVVVVSHAFTNWSLGEESRRWRWVLLPEFYAHWRKKNNNCFPYGYYKKEILSDIGIGNKNNELVSNVAESICSAIPSNESHPAQDRIKKLFLNASWPGVLEATEYKRGNSLRPWLECVVGLGLGVFDLVIIDEAHKSRGIDSGLYHLLENVILPSNDARRLGMTATPVELDISQWKSTLSRISLKDEAMTPINQAIENYAAAVNRIRQAWRSSPEAREVYKRAAAEFQKALSPYLIRRDKREDLAVMRFVEHSGLPFGAYRKESEIVVETTELSPAWKQAVCAAEALSIITHQADDSVAQRLRLTIGNGHGITALLDQIKRDDDDLLQEQDDAQSQLDNRPKPISNSKSHDRAKWWLENIKDAFADKDNSLFDHPAILAAVNAIEKATEQGEKVLVFGRFTRPLRTLVDLLNAREMLRRLQKNQPWPQAKVHGSKDGDPDTSEWPAVNAAHKQLNVSVSLDNLDERLQESYNKQRRQRDKLHTKLIGTIGQGLKDIKSKPRFHSIVAELESSIGKHSSGGSDEYHPLALLTRAITELVGESVVDPSEYAQAFIQLIEAITDHGGSHINEQSDETEVFNWLNLFEHLKEEYNRPQGGYARLMYGGTNQASRRMIQLAFNRQNSFPKVLVAQSMVGREGLNLHKACRMVVMLHPEWNPGVVEQQIGRVDRVGSYWSAKLNEAISVGQAGEQLPRIEIRPVIFRGTYDEYNWEVLNERWDDLRAQLHGIIVPHRLINDDPESRGLIDEISKTAPNFSPQND
jgi:superfamily II DNA or RNA helicase